MVRTHTLIIGGIALGAALAFLPQETRAHGAALDRDGCHRVRANQAEHCHNPAYRAEVRRALDGGRLSVRAQFSPQAKQGVPLVVRLKGVDVPQTANSKCAFARELAAKARTLLKNETRQGVLLFDVEGDSSDGSARAVRAHVFTPQFVSLADRLVAEGLARPLALGRRPWCQGEEQTARAPMQKNHFYLLGMIGASVVEFGPGSSPPGGAWPDRLSSSAFSFGIGYARTLYKALFVGLESTVDYHAAPQPITAQERAHESRVQFGLNTLLGWRFARAQFSFFAGPHWVQIASERAGRSPPGVLQGGVFSLDPMLYAGVNIWQGWRLGSGLLYPMNEHWALSTEYRFARVQGSAGGVSDTLDYHSIAFGLRYDF